MVMKYSIIILLLAIMGCGDLTGSPFTDQSQSNLRDSNSKNLSRLQPNSFPLRFAMVSDSHQNLDPLNSVVKRINSSNVDFTVHIGDFTDSGYSMEYDLFIQVIRRLSDPFFVAIGNHDALVEGKKLFKKHFGPYNFSFDYKGIRFIIFNNISLEYKLDYDWLENEITTSPLPVFLFQHIPMDGDIFSADELARNKAILDNPKLKVVFHGHDHKFTTKWHDNDTLIQQIARTEGEHYGIAEVQNGVLRIWECAAGTCDEKVNFNINN